MDHKKTLRMHAILLVLVLSTVLSLADVYAADATSCINGSVEDKDFVYQLQDVAACRLIQQQDPNETNRTIDTGAVIVALVLAISGTCVIVVLFKKMRR